jgi:hypothetical protein
MGDVISKSPGMFGFQDVRPQGDHLYVPRKNMGHGVEARRIWLRACLCSFAGGCYPEIHTSYDSMRCAVHGGGTTLPVMLQCT